MPDKGILKDLWPRSFDPHMAPPTLVGSPFMSAYRTSLERCRRDNAPERGARFTNTSAAHGSCGHRINTSSCTALQTTAMRLFRAAHECRFSIAFAAGRRACHRRDCVKLTCFRRILNDVLICTLDLRQNASSENDK
jgi:hypothetical protein